MKKIISSVLVFALMGEPVISGVFANQNIETIVEDVVSLSENQPLYDTHYFQNVYEIKPDETILRDFSITIKSGNETSQKVIEVPKQNDLELNKDQNKKTLDEYENNKEDDKLEEFYEESTENKKGMSTSKKLLIATSI